LLPKNLVNLGLLGYGKNWNFIFNYSV
jgi:hypothetical protein